MTKETWLRLQLSYKNAFIHQSLRVALVFQLGILHRPYPLSKVILGNLRRAVALAHTLGHRISAAWLNHWELKVTVSTLHSRRRSIIYVHSSEPGFTDDHS